MRAWYGTADVHVCVTQIEPNDATVEEFWVHPKQRGHGLGRKLFQEVIDDADAEGIVLWLEPAPFSHYDRETDEVHLPGLRPGELRAFYRSFGFRMKPKPFDNIMTRNPRRR